MSKKIYLLVLSAVFIGVNLNLDGMAADPHLITQAEANNISQKLNTFPHQSNGVRTSIGGTNHREHGVAIRVQVEKLLECMENLHMLNDLLEEYNDDLTGVKNDPRFDEIKPALKETYEMLSSIPFLLSIARDGIDMFKAQIEESLAKKATIKGFEEMNEDLQELMDDTFSYSDKFLEFLRKFSKHFVDNKIVQELLAD